MLPDTSRFFEQGMADRQNALSQYNIGTGRRPTADQEYSFGQGMMSPLLDYDLKRRQQAIENRLAQQRLALQWQQGHDQRKSQSSDFERYTKGIIGGLMAVTSPLTGGATSGAGASLLGGNAGIVVVFHPTPLQEWLMSGDRKVFGICGGITWHGAI